MSVVVKICSGTTCYIMGGAELLAVADELTAEEQELVSVEASTCLGVCKDFGPKAPYVKVNDEVIASATMEILVAKIRQELAAEEAEND